MELLFLLCKGTALVTLTLFLLSVLYAVISTLLKNILMDCRIVKKYVELKEDYEQLLKKVQKLEVELVDKQLEIEYTMDRLKKN